MAARRSCASRSAPACRRGSMPTRRSGGTTTADGWLDLFLSGYWREDIDLWHLKTTRIMPESFEYAENGGRKYVFHNRGDGTFEEVSAALGIQSRRWTLAAAAADLSGSGYPDLFLANDYGVAQLYVNKAASASPRSGETSGVGQHAEERHERVVRRHLQRRPAVHLQDQHLRARSAGAGQRSLGAESAVGRARRSNSRISRRRMGVDLGGWSWGAQFGDLNNDGTLDMYLVNGYVSAGERTSYWYDFAEIAVGHNRIIGDASNWPADARAQPVRLSAQARVDQRRRRPLQRGRAGRWRHRHLRRPRRRARGFLESRRSRHHRRQPARPAADLHEHRQPRPALDRVRARRHGEQSQRDWRARRSRSGSGQRQVQEVSGGSGFSAQNQRRLHFGLGTVDGRSTRSSSAGRQAHAKRLQAPAVDRLHTSRRPR